MPIMTNKLIALTYVLIFCLFLGAYELYGRNRILEKQLDDYYGMISQAYQSIGGLSDRDFLIGRLLSKTNIRISILEQRKPQIIRRYEPFQKGP